MNPSTITRHLVTALALALALALAIAILWLWPTAAHAQSTTTTIRGAGLQPLVEESGSTQTLNIYGPGGVIIAQVATDSPAGGTPTTQTRYLLHDHLGSTRVVLDSNNQVLGSFDYSPFGETTVSNGAAGNVADVAYRYTGQEVNGALGTYNYHARHYDAGVGRFLGVDPARQFASLYAYVGNNPTNFVDRSGRQLNYAQQSRQTLYHLLVAYNSRATTLERHLTLIQLNEQINTLSTRARSLQAEYMEIGAQVPRARSILGVQTTYTNLLRRRLGLRASAPLPPPEELPDIVPELVQLFSRAGQSTTGAVMAARFSRMVERIESEFSQFDQHSQRLAQLRDEFTDVHRQQSSLISHRDRISAELLQSHSPHVQRDGQVRTSRQSLQQGLTAINQERSAISTELARRSSLAETAALIRSSVDILYGPR